MRTFPIIPISLMVIICVILSFFVFYNSKNRLNDFIIIILLFVINLRIMIPTDNMVGISSNLDVLFVIDNTISMNALDYNGNSKRLDGAKNDCKNIINSLYGSNFSVITFDNKSKIVIPFTRDINMVTESIDMIEPIDELYAKGTSLELPKNDIVKLLNYSDEERLKIIFFISDGEITNNSNLDSYKEISKFVDNGAVLGYGTTNGGYMMTKDRYTGEYKYIMDTSDFKYEKAISKMDEKNLKKIADDIEIEYINMDSYNKINQKLKDINKMSISKINSFDKDSYEDIYYYFVIPLLFLLVKDFKRYKRINI